MYTSRIKAMIDEIEDIENHVNAEVYPLTEIKAKAISDAMASAYRIFDDLIDLLEETK